MPAGSEGSGPELPVRFRPVGVRIAAIGFGVVLVLTVVVVWLTLTEEARATFNLSQKLTVGGMILAVVVIGHALSRCRVDADETGLVVVNGYRTHRFAWEQVLAVTLRPGSPWAELDLTDGTTQAALGIQGSDGLRARQQTRRLRALIEAHAAAEPPAERPERPEDGPPG
jgi:hypothetical protein